MLWHLPCSHSSCQAESRSSCSYCWHDFAWPWTCWHWLRPPDRSRSTGRKSSACGISFSRLTIHIQLPDNYVKSLRFFLRRLRNACTNMRFSVAQDFALTRIRHETSKGRCLSPVRIDYSEIALHTWRNINDNDEAALLRFLGYYIIWACVTGRPPFLVQLSKCSWWLARHLRLSIDRFGRWKKFM